MTSTIGHVVVQTHWDREWYFTREQYLARLIRAAAHFVAELEADRLESFLFDGQTIAVEDLLAACEPALAERVEALIATGRIAVGPWYVSADEFLVDGECLVRNLERGMARALEFGKSQRIGYVPDTFGHIGQLPQILTGFGIGSAVLWRGSDHPWSEAEWEAPDGSRVFAVLLTQGYYQHPFNLPDWQTAVTAYFRSIKGQATTDHLLLTQGGDHLVTVERMTERVAAYNAAQDAFHLRLGDLEGYIAAVRPLTRDLAVITGELRQNARAFVLPDVLSTRRYLKEANQRLEDRLLGLVEPLLAVATPDPGAYPQRYLARTWDMLLQQQAHDSICGCSIDAVHEEMMIRFAAIDDRLQALVDHACRALGMINDRTGSDADPSPFADDSRATLFNPSPRAFSGWIEADLFLAGPAHPRLSATRVDGQPIEVAILSHRPDRAFISPLDDFPEHVDGHRYRVALRTDLDGLQLAGVEIGGEAGETPRLAEDVIQNEFLAIAVDEQEGAVVVTDQLTGQRYPGLFTVESTLDAGDSYNFSPPPHRCSVRARLGNWHAQAAGAVQTLVIDLAIDQPSGLSADRAGPSDTMARSGGRLVLRLLRGERLIRGTLDWHNNACDHRLRLQFALPGPVSSTSSDGGFAWTTRPVVLAQIPDTPSRAEMPVSVNPSHSVIAAGPFGLFHRGLQEFEVERRDGQDWLGVTLLRSVGWLSRRDLVTRGVGAGPDMATPGAQCLGPHHYDFALTIGADRDTLLHAASAWRRPPALLKGHACVSSQGLALSDPRVQVSGLRRVGGAIELRLWNPGADPIPVDLPGWQVEAVDLARRPVKEWTGTLGPHAITTLLLTQPKAVAQ